jgi:hypothetical protein
MARTQKIDLSKLSIASLIGAFAAALEAALAEPVDAPRANGQLAHWAVWTVMAATLTELRSRLLLPQDAKLARAAEAAAEALRQQLLDRARMRCGSHRTRRGRAAAAAAAVVDRRRRAAPVRPPAAGTTGWLCSDGLLADDPARRASARRGRLDADPRHPPGEWRGGGGRVASLTGAAGATGAAGSSASTMSGSPHDLYNRTLRA